MNLKSFGPAPAAILAIVLAALAVLMWIVRVELVVLFASILFGVALFAAARWLSDRTPLSHRAAIVATYVTGLVLAIVLAFACGKRIESEIGSLSEKLPQTLSAVEDKAADLPFRSITVPEIRDLRERLSSTPARQSDQESEEEEEQRARLVKLTMSGLGNFFIWAVLSFYVAYDGERYIKAILRVVPPHQRGIFAELLSALGTALPWWLVGRLASMGVVMLLTAPALLILDIPLAFVLAIIAGLCSFVPYIGPVVSFIPAALVTIEGAPDKMPWLIASYMMVQFIESYILTPVIQDRVASVPPILLISSQLLLGVLVGAVGVMFATPIVLTLLIAVQVIWLRFGLQQSIVPIGLEGEHLKSTKQRSSRSQARPAKSQPSSS